MVVKYYWIAIVVGLTITSETGPERFDWCWSIETRTCFGVYCEEYVHDLHVVVGAYGTICVGWIVVEST
jgi:hypothetical protein